MRIGIHNGKDFYAGLIFLGCGLVALFESRTYRMGTLGPGYFPSLVAIPLIPLGLVQGGYVLVDHRMATNIPGIFAAGDIRCQSAMQVATATGDGFTAAISAYKLIVEGR
jgi:hypothetical protein